MARGPYTVATDEDVFNFLQGCIDALASLEGKVVSPAQGETLKHAMGAFSDSFGAATQE